jgi:hypothetical protein
MMNDQAGRFRSGGGQKWAIGGADDFVDTGIKSEVIWSYYLAKTGRDIATLCRLSGGSSSIHHVIRHTVGVLDSNMLCRDWGHLSELSSVRFSDFQI